MKGALNTTNYLSKEQKDPLSQTTKKPKKKVSKQKTKTNLGIPGLESSTITEDDIEIFNTVKVNQRREPTPEDSVWDDQISVGTTSKKLKRAGTKTIKRNKASKAHYGSV